ncbi:MAG: Ig-like domain-containing protein, partial [Anaerolineales bacterium]
ASINATSGAFTWTPTEAQGPGEYTFDVCVSDGALEDCETITVTVIDVNVAPIAVSQTVYATPGTPVSFTVSASDPDGDTITYILVSGPAHGVLSGTLPDLTYTADADWPGSDSIQFKVTDGVLESEVAIVTLTGPGQSFADVPTTYWAWRHIEAIYAAGITTGCGTSPLIYCPGATVTRDQMAVFLLRGIHGAGYTPPDVGSSTGFADVPVTHWAAAWIKQFAIEGITAGCGGGNYCPGSPVTREQMAVFLLRAKYGAPYTPPDVGSSTGFADVPVTHWAAAWIKQLAAEGITTGCGGGNFCPSTPVSRDQMAVFIQRTFNLPLP